MSCNIVQFTRHAKRRMAERFIDPEDVLYVVRHGAAIEEHPDDPRGQSCLMLAFVGDRPIHVVVGIAGAPEVCEIISAYEPTLDEWEPDYRTRKRR